ncbi:MAG: GTP-binding protein [Candidatus Lokiarchaeota archaeon]|nr:GTP-binding protein [Candidatus Lokiarchaeota archaeon]
MGIKDILKRVFTKEKKIVITGLDSAGKTTMISFLQNGTFMEHTPTMGKELSQIEVQGIRINVMDMGGQKDFRDLWIGEASTAECVIFMIDAGARERFNEAKDELWKLSSIFKKKPLIVLANKYDLQPIASISEIIAALNLKDLPSFEVLPISCKTGYGIVKAFMKMYYKLTGKQLTQKTSLRAITIFDQGGIPLTSSSNKDILQGGLFTAIHNFVRESFNSELDQLKMGEHLILFKRSKHLMGSIIVNDNDNVDIKEAESGLNDLLLHLEHMCPELEKEQLNYGKIEYLVEQYASNLF